MGTRTVALVGVSTLLFFSACKGKGVDISADTVDFPWPFTVASGRVECQDGQAVVFISNGITYSLNGLADSRAATRGYSDLKPIWKADPAIPGMRINIGPVVDLGLSKC